MRTSVRKFTIYSPVYTIDECSRSTNFAINKQLNKISETIIKYKLRTMEKVVNAYLQITMKIKESDRQSAAKVYFDYREPFLNTIEGALTKSLLVRDEDVQVLHGFDSKEHAAAYLESEMFKNDVAKGLSPYFQADPEIRIFTVAG